MTGDDVYKILKQRGVSHLHHANSLSTSISFLQLNGLASRELVEASGLSQTTQYTDGSDKVLGVWGDIFLDTIDIHKRASRQNHYGPILFVVKLEILKTIEVVSITKSNPSKWGTYTPDKDRYFTTVSELEQGLVIGDFGQMLTLKTPSGLVKFNNHLESILIDDPILGEHPSEHFTNAASEISKRTSTSIYRRQCSPWCKCTNNYSDVQLLSKMYNPC